MRSVDGAAPGSRLNLLLTDGAAIWATTWTHALSVREGAGHGPVASEPLDDDPGPDRRSPTAPVVAAGRATGGYRRPR